MKGRDSADVFESLDRFPGRVGFHHADRADGATPRKHGAIWGHGETEIGVATHQTAAQPQSVTKHGVILVRVITSSPSEWDRTCGHQRRRVVTLNWAVRPCRRKLLGDDGPRPFVWRRSTSAALGAGPGRLLHPTSRN